MHFAEPGVVKKFFPGLVPDNLSRREKLAPAGFMDALVSAMGLEDLFEPRPGSGVDQELFGFWRHLVMVGAAPRSQYDALREMVATGEPLPGHIACVALQGTGFHGQHGRHWNVATGNLHLSAALACDLPVAEFAPVLPALPAVAVTEAVAALGQGHLLPGIKWVNDVLLGERKVAGSLTAVRTFRGRITAVVVGIGLNVQHIPDLAPDRLAAPATALAAELPGSAPALETVLREVLAQLAGQFRRLTEGGPAALLAAYRAWSMLPGRRVAVWPDDGTSEQPLCTGEVQGIGADLSLGLVGMETAVTTGRLTLFPRGT